MDTEKQLRSLTRHIDNVRDSATLLGTRLIEQGEAETGLKLIANGYCHDQSKFKGIEWLHLNEDTRFKQPDLFNAAHLQHVTTNLHHPEAWTGGIRSMTPEYLAEMVCDWHARASEFGTDLREWIKDKATKKFDITCQTSTYREIKEFVDILLDPRFR
jgi:hypothetical protein